MDWTRDRLVRRMEGGLAILTRRKTTRRDASARTILKALCHGWVARRVGERRYRALLCWAYRRGVLGALVELGPKVEPAMMRFDEIGGPAVDRIIGRSPVEAGNAVLAFEAFDEAFEELCESNDREAAIQNLAEKVTAYIYCGNTEQDMLQESAAGRVKPEDLLVCWVLCAHVVAGTASFAKELLEEAPQSTVRS